MCRTLSGVLRISRMAHQTRWGVAARPLDAHRAVLLLAAAVLTVGSSSRRQQAIVVFPVARTELSRTCHPHRGPRVRILFPPVKSRANHRFLSGGAHVPHSRALGPRHLGDTRRGRTRRHGESVAQTRGQRQVGLLAAGEGGRLITTSGPKSAVVLESSLADNIASPANDIERGGLLGIAIPNRRGRWQSCSKTALVSFGRSRR